MNLLCKVFLVMMEVIGIKTPIGLRPVRPLVWYAIVRVEETAT
jgi:hypothetical protein